MRRRLRSLLFSVSLSVPAVAACTALHASNACAQSNDELGAGRQLFAEALVDEEQHRFADALGKYKRVLKIRDTIAIRYRIGTTCEGMRDIVQAIDAYSNAVRLGSGPPIATGTDAAVVKASQARIDALTPKVAHLALQWKPTTSIPESEIRVDDEPVPADTLADVTVNPGAHVISAAAKGARPFRAQVSLSEGGRAEIPILLEPALVAPPPPPPPPSPDSSSFSLRTIGIVTGIAGGVFVVGGLIVLALRSSAISTLNDSCPAGNCPAAREQELRSTRDRALVEGPLSAVLIGTGVVAIGTGVVLYVLGSTSPSATTVTLRLGPAMMTLTKSF